VSREFRPRISLIHESDGKKIAYIAQQFERGLMLNHLQCPERRIPRNCIIHVFKKRIARNYSDISRRLPAWWDIHQDSDEAMSYLMIRDAAPVHKSRSDGPEYGRDTDRAVAYVPIQCSIPSLEIVYISAFAFLFPTKTRMDRR
jgi:hypothetical protein